MWTNPAGGDKVHLPEIKPIITLFPLAGVVVSAMACHARAKIWLQVQVFDSKLEVADLGLRPREA